MIAWGVALIAWGGLLYLCAQHARVWVFDYEVTAEGVTVLWFGRWRGPRWAWARVRDVKLLSPLAAALLWPAEWRMAFWLNRLFATHVVLELDSGWLVVITPSSSGAMEIIRGKIEEGL